MTAEQLNKMQEEARKRHPAPTVEVVENKEKTLTEVLNENFDFYDGELKPKKKYKKREKNILPDLMADQIPLPCTSEQTEDIPVIQKPEVMNSPTFNAPHVPKPVQEKKYFKAPVFQPDPPPQKWERPKAQYSNIPSPFGIASELLAEQLKEGR